MTQPEYDAWLANAIKGYAQDKVQAGAREAGEALERSWAEFQWLLPKAWPVLMEFVPHRAGQSWMPRQRAILRSA
jgi:hypothetical protein